MELFENPKPYRWFLDTLIYQWQNLHSSTGCQLLHREGLTVAKMGEHEQLSHQYGIKYLKRRKITYCSIYTACVKKSLKKTQTSQPKFSQRLSQNADSIFKYNSNLNNELRIKERCQLGVICTELRGPTDPGPLQQESVCRHKNLNKQSVLVTALLGHPNQPAKPVLSLPCFKASSILKEFSKQQFKARM